MKNKPYRVSVAMATYNGAAFIREQLESFAIQTCRPQEVVITDDGSSDTTIAIAEEFSRTAPFDVRIYRNPERLGFAGNFEKALSLCVGDIIFLSDQDDVWFSNKIETVCNFFYKNPEIQVVVNDHEITDADLRPSGNSALENIRRAGVSLDLFCTGCCTAMRKSWRDFALPLPSAAKSHDQWISRLASTIGSRHVLPDQLQVFRRHGSNTSDWVLSRPTPPNRFVLFLDTLRTSSKSAWEQEVDLSEAICAQLRQRDIPVSAGISQSMAEEVCRKLEKRVEGLRARIEICSKPHWKRLPGLLGFALRGGYSEFGGLKSLIRDLSMPRTSKP